MNWLDIFIMTYFAFAITFYICCGLELYDDYDGVSIGRLYMAYVILTPVSLMWPLFCVRAIFRAIAKAALDAHEKRLTEDGGNECGR